MLQKAKQLPFGKFKEKNESDLLFLNRQISHLKNQFSESEKAFILCISKVNEKMNFYNSKFKLSD